MVFTHTTLVIILLISLWTLPWKGLALWKAAQRDDKMWFIILLVVNTLALLEIFYIFFIANRTSVDVLEKSEAKRS